MGGTDTPAHEVMNVGPVYDYGLPMMIDADEDDPPTFESQAAYLKRYGLLLAGEDARVRKNGLTSHVVLWRTGIGGVGFRRLSQRVGVDHSAAAATQAHVVRGNAGFDVDVWRAFGHDGGYRRADRPLQIGVTWLANLGAASYHITHYRYDDTNYAYATMVYRLA